MFIVCVMKNIVFIILNVNGEGRFDMHVIKEINKFVMITYLFHTRY